MLLRGNIGCDIFVLWSFSSSFPSSEWAIRDFHVKSGDICYNSCKAAEIASEKLRNNYMWVIDGPLFFSRIIGTIHSSCDNLGSAHPNWAKFSHFGIIRRRHFWLVGTFFELKTRLDRVRTRLTRWRRFASLDSRVECKLEFNSTRRQHYSALSKVTGHSGIVYPAPCTLRSNGQICCGSWGDAARDIYDKTEDDCAFYSLRIDVYLKVWINGWFSVRLIYSQRSTTRLWTSDTSRGTSYRSIEMLQVLKWEKVLTRTSLRQEYRYFINLIFHRIGGLKTHSPTLKWGPNTS
jgi:hypothetical protein